MTEAELEKLRWQCRALAAETVLQAMWNAAGRFPPTFRQSLLQEGSQWGEQSAQKMTLTGFPPEYSDLVTAEFLEAFRELIQKMGGWK